MDLLVLPNIQNTYKRERARDELPQSAAGRTIMTTEPKFVPNEAVEITVGGNLKLKTRLVDCVGYLVNNALGYMAQDSTWFVVESGDNVFTYDADSGNSNLQLTFTTSILYSGV